MEETDDFEKTLIWAVEEEKLRATRGQSIGTFYLVILSTIIFVICFLVLFYSNRRKKRSALEMMKDSENEFDEFDEEETEDVALIDMSEEEEYEEPELEEDVVKPNTK